jgi:hypothetical protein
MHGSPDDVARARVHPKREDSHRDRSLPLLKRAADSRSRGCGNVARGGGRNG